MLISRLFVLSALSGPALLLVGCNKQPALTTPSGAQSAFAEDYPARLKNVRTRFEAEETRTRASFDGIRGLPSRLTRTDAGAALAAVREADAAGRSEFYADEAMRREDMEVLLTDGRGSLRRRVAASVAYTAKEKECSKEDAAALGNSAGWAAERALNRQLEQRLHHYSEASRYIEAHAEQLGQGNIEALEKQTDAIARASFVSYVRLELYRRELEQLLAEQASVDATLERGEREGNEELAEAGTSNARKASIKERVARSQAARAELAPESEAARLALDGMRDKIRALQKDYDLLIATLLDELEHMPSLPAVAKSAPAAGTTPAASTATPPSPAPVVDPGAPATGETAPAAEPVGPPPAPDEPAPAPTNTP
jgi:hypothetical protein